MSRAFMKEADESAGIENLPDRPQSDQPNYVTAEGLHALEERVAELAQRRRALSSEETLASRQELSIVERDLRYYEERVKRAICIEPDHQPSDRVHFGATVRVCDDDEAEQVFRIVGEDEADVAKGKISWTSPLAQALLNRSVGDVVVWRRPAGDKELQILEITPLGRQRPA